jgi:two-component system sensor histidine kinase ChvG
MNLKRQLLLVSLLLLALPWAGMKFVGEMQNVLRNSQEQAALATTQAIANAMASQVIGLNIATNYDYQDIIYAQPSQDFKVLDGYSDDWSENINHRYTSAANPAFSLSYQAAASDKNIYLLITVDDPAIAYHNPQISKYGSGDHLRITTKVGSATQKHVIAASAPGATNGFTISGSANNKRINNSPISAYWLDTNQGYRIELSIPKELTIDGLGFAIINQSGKATTSLSHWLGNYSPKSTTAPPPLIAMPISTISALSIFNTDGIKLSVIDAQQWQRAATGSISFTTNEQATNWLLKKFYRYLLAENLLDTKVIEPTLGRITRNEVAAALNGQASSRWYKSSERKNTSILSVASPIRFDNNIVGVVIAEQSSDRLLAQTDKAFSQLLYYSALAIIISLLGLLAYATLLSSRIGKLSQAVQNAINDDGSINPLKASTASDEIGDLSRHYQQLLERLQEYIDYLRTLSRKLSHELRTPIAVIQSSLENIEHDEDESQRKVYTMRAQQGLTRLGNILTAISEASRLDESIKNHSPEQFDLSPLLQEVSVAYQSIYPQHIIKLSLPNHSCVISGVPDLIVQMLDKLMDNAADFCPPQGTISIDLAANKGSLILSVSNQGPLLPDSMKTQLFDSMVSIRAENNNDLHLGLGLHIVKLIADYHQASISAFNLADGCGVCFSIKLAAVN